MCEPSRMAPDLAARLAQTRFPRSAGYDPQWLIDNVMGPHLLWLMEWLWPALDLPPGARVLDLGCGTALTSIFLAREYDADVVAADLWVDPTDNWPRIAAAGCAGRLLPLRVEAHDLPFAEGYFDAVVSIDAYHYFGTDERYLAYLSRFLAPGGRIGIAMPGLVTEFDDDQVPEHLRSEWEPDFWTFHSPRWWRQLWSPERVGRGRPCGPSRGRMACLGAVDRGVRRRQSEGLRAQVSRQRSFEHGRATAAPGRDGTARRRP